MGEYAQEINSEGSTDYSDIEVEDVSVLMDAVSNCNPNVNRIVLKTDL